MRVLSRLVFCLTLLHTACVSAPVTHRRQMILISDQQMNQLGSQGYDELLKENRIVKDPHLVDPIESIAKNLAVASDKKLDWAFALIESPQINAFCMPGGKIGVFTGILPVAQNNAGLAAVLGHEIAHAVAKHGAERLSQTLVAETVLKGADVAMGNRRDHDIIMAALGLGTNFGVLMPFSRQHENEADRIGLMYMAQAGYDPREAIQLWKRMAQQGGGNPPEFLSTHPSAKTRIKNLEKYLPAALASYERSHKQPTVLLPGVSGVAH